MPRQAQLSVENNFVNGLVTEATGLNFPENAVTETYDCEFDIDGSVYRRRGFDFEELYATKTISRAAKAISYYTWNNVSGNGNLNLLVMQVGATLHFFQADESGNYSNTPIASTVTLTGVSGAPTIETVECQYTDGNGYLIVTHPYVDPVRISYDEGSSTASATTLTLQIRDFEGDTTDPYAVDARPTATLAGLDTHHKYNLYNQGWTTANLTAWDTAQTTMPSNADVMWRFKDSSDNFDASTASINRITTGNTPAPNGHFIINLATQNRETVSGITGVNMYPSSHYRPSTCAYFAGRVFYAGINYTKYTSNIYFTQIIEDDSQYAKCFQVNDPTAEDLFDLLPSDGGVISIQEAGTIYKMMTVPGGMCVFASNGVWFITGSQGIGFTATDYSVQKIANINCISHTSFVNVQGLPCWWNAEGIYLMTIEGSSPNVKSISYEKIKAFYDDIPVTSKRFAKGFYHVTDGHIRWLYKTEATTNIDNIYEYDRVLNFNVRTGAFYPWTISDNDVKVHGIFPTALISKPVSLSNVVNGADNVVDGSGNQVVAFVESGSESMQFDKYIVSYLDGSNTLFTFAERSNTDFIDWYSKDNIGVNYISYLISGYKLKGGIIRKFSNNWVRVFSRLQYTEASKYYFQGLWDFAVTGSGTGRWSVQQLVEHTDTNYSNASRRLKVRGHGLALQFKVTSFQGQPFDIIGWSAIQSNNQVP